MMTKSRAIGYLFRKRPSRILNLSISLTALLTFLESLSCDGIIDDIDLTRDSVFSSVSSNPL